VQRGALTGRLTGAPTAGQLARKTLTDYLSIIHLAGMAPSRRRPVNSALGITLMSQILEIVKLLSSDLAMFSLLQIMLAVALVTVVSKEALARRRAGRGGASLSVKRGELSLAKFYGAYLALNGLLVAICLSIDVIDGYRVFWVVVDTLIPAYICIFNPWARNLLLSWSNHISEIEAR